MDSRERVLLALEHKEPDRVPIDYWATSEVNAMLLKRYSLSSQEELLKHFGSDFRYIDGPKYIGPEPTARDDGSKEDHYGVPRKSVSYGQGSKGGTYSEVVEYPLEKMTSVEEIKNYSKWPKADCFDYDSVREQAKRARDLGKVVIFMGDRLNRWSTCSAVCV